MVFIAEGSQRTEATSFARRCLKAAVAAISLATVAIVGLAGLSGCTANGADGIPQLKAATLSEPAIAEDGVLRVGVNSGNSPLAGSSGERIIGIDVDIAAALADELGLSVEVLDVGSDGADAIQSNEVDVVLGVESGSAESGCWLSSQYLQTGVVLFQEAGGTASAPPADATSLDIAAQVSSKSAWAVTNVFGDDSLAAATDLGAAFSSLESGDVDYVASDAVIGLYAANRQGTDVQVCALLESLAGYCAMVSDSNAELQSAISDALSTIKGNGVLAVIESKWLGVEVDLSGISKVEGEGSQSTNAAVTGDGEDGDDGSDSDGNDSSASGAGASSSSKSSSASSASSSSSSSSSSASGA